MRRPPLHGWRRLLPAGRWRRLLPACLLALPLALGACADVAYYWQAGLGQLEILRKRRPIAEVLADPSTPVQTARKLRLILAVQDFATEDLALPAEGHYTTYADLGRPYVSWLVVAAPEFSLEAHRFCYLVVGCLGYRGFFEREDADALAAELHGEGLDVSVRPVSAYSTLGWFNDPVLNTFLAGDDVSLIGTVIHEQAHRRYFLEDATDFNESFAEFVEEQGVQRFLTLSRPPPGLLTRPAARMLAAARAMRDDERRFRALVLGARKRLAALYAAPLPAAEKRRRKAGAIDALRQDYQKQRASFKLLDYDDWFAQPLNNAHLAGIAQYARHIGAFRALFDQSAHDFARFYTAVEALGALPADQRATRLSQLEHAGVAQLHPPR